MKHTCDCCDSANAQISALLAERDALREAGDLALNALDELLGDSDFPEDDRPGVLAMQALCRALNPEGAECHRLTAQHRSGSGSLFAPPRSET